MSNYLVTDTDLTSVANAIRTKGGTSAALEFPFGFVSAVQAIPTGGGAAKMETGTFTLTADTKTFTINHSLGTIPNFCVVYPIDVPKATTTYRIAWELIVRDIGQSDYNISSYSATYGTRHAMWQGVAYNITANPGATVFHNISGSDAGNATDSTFVVGGCNNTQSGGTLSAGTFGYILGVA